MVQQPKSSGWPWKLGPITTGLGAVGAAFSPQGSYMAAKPMTQQAASAPTPGTRYVDEALLDAKLQASEARTETKFAQLLGKLELIGQQIGGLNDKIGGFDKKIGDIDGHVRSAKSTYIAIALGTGIAVAALAYAAVQIFEGALGLFPK